MRAVIFNRIGWCTLLLVMLATAAEAQRRGGTTRRRTATQATQQDPNAVVNPATGNAVAPPLPPLLPPTPRWDHRCSVSTPRVNHCA